MKILHISVAGICDKFYETFLSAIQSSLNICQDLYIPYCKEDYKEVDLEIISKYEKGGIHTIALPIKNKSDRIFYHKKINKYMKKLEKTSNIKKYTLIHAHSLYSDGGVAYLLNKKYGVPYITAVRTTDLVFMERLPYLKNYGKRIIANAKKVVFITPDIRKMAEQYLYKNSDFLVEKGVVIPNGMDDYWHQNLSINYKILNEKNIRLIQVSRLNKRKHVDKTIKAVEILKKEGYNVSLHILGIGDKLGELKRLVKQLQLENEVNFVGFIANKNDIKKYYNESDIFIMPSLGETFGLTYIEAMSQGLPIIGIKNTGVSGFFENGSVGYFIDFPDAEMIAEAVKKIISNYSEISGNSIKAIQHFRWSSIISIYKEIYGKYIKC